MNAITLAGTFSTPTHMTLPPPVSNGLHGVWVDTLMPLSQDQRLDLALTFSVGKLGRMPPDFSLGATRIPRTRT